jgi:hypothetical protein
MKYSQLLIDLAKKKKKKKKKKRQQTIFHLLRFPFILHPISTWVGEFFYVLCKIILIQTKKKKKIFSQRFMTFPFSKSASV